MSYPQPTDKHDDGRVTWHVHAAQVTAYPAAHDHGPAVEIQLEDRTLSPQTAVDLAQALQAAAMHVLRVPAKPDDGS